MADQLTVIAGEVYLGHWHVATLTDKAPPTILKIATDLMESAEDVSDDALTIAYNDGHNDGYRTGYAEGKADNA